MQTVFLILVVGGGSEGWNHQHSLEDGEGGGGVSWKHQLVLKDGEGRAVIWKHQFVLVMGGEEEDGFISLHLIVANGV